MDRKKTSSPDEAVEKKAYEPPRIVYREPLEAVATACVPPGGKADAVNCSTGPILS